MKKKLIGFKRFTSRKGNPLCVAIIATAFDKQQNERGSFGCDAESVFLPSEQYDYLNADDLGKEVSTQYDMVGGRAYLRELTVARGKAGKEGE